MSQKLIVTIGIDLGKNTFHVIGLDARGTIVLRQRRTRAQLMKSLANVGPCLIGMEACSGAHHLGRKLERLGHRVRLMPAQYVKPYLKGHKNDYRDAEAVAEAVQRPTMRFVPLKSPNSSICRRSTGFAAGLSRREQRSSIKFAAFCSSAVCLFDKERQHSDWPFPEFFRRDRRFSRLKCSGLSKICAEDWRHLDARVACDDERDRDARRSR